ncbi:MAG: TonB family protein [Sulfurimonas sp.]
MIKKARFVIAIVISSLLHGGIFYSLDEPPLKLKPKEMVEISMVDEVVAKKLDEPKRVEKPKPVQKPKPVLKRVQKPKPKKPAPKPELKQEELKQEELKQEELKQEEPKQEEPKQEVVETSERVDEPQVDEQSASQTEQNLSASSSELDSYLAKLRAKIEQNLRYPLLAKRLKLEGEVMISFSILDDGAIKKLTIISSSGSKSLDEAAIKTIEAILPFEKPPKKDMQVEVPIRFSLR